VILDIGSEGIGTAVPKDVVSVRFGFVRNSPNSGDFTLVEPVEAKVLACTDGDVSGCPLIAAKPIAEPRRLAACTETRGTVASRRDPATAGDYCFVDCLFLKLSSTTDGGAVNANVSNSAFTITGCQFGSCRANAWGGAVAFGPGMNGDVSMVRSCFDNCSTYGVTGREGSCAGAIAFRQNVASEPDVRECSCTNCSTGYEGGAINWRVKPSMHHCNFTACTAARYYTGGDAPDWATHGGGAAFMLRYLAADWGIEYVYVKSCESLNDAGAIKSWLPGGATLDSVTHIRYSVFDQGTTGQPVARVEKGMTIFHSCAFVGTNLFMETPESGRITCVDCVFEAGVPSGNNSVFTMSGDANRKGVVTLIEQCWFNSHTPGPCPIQYTATCVSESLSEPPKTVRPSRARPGPYVRARRIDRFALFTVVIMMI
jgi:hypothetical protein